MANPLDDFLATKGYGAPSGNPLDDHLTARNVQNSNPLDAYLSTQGFAATPLIPEEKEQAPAEPRMGEDESFLNRPLTTYAGIPEYREGAGGIERGVEKFASGLTSPLSLGLLLVTGGVGSIAEAGAATAGEEVAGTLGAKVLSSLAPETAASVAKAAQVVDRLSTAGFTAQQIYGMTQAIPQIGDAIKTGDYDRALELGTTSALGAVAAGLGTMHFVHTFGREKSPVWTQDKEVLGAYQQPVREHAVIAQQFEKDNASLIKNPSMDIAARLYHEAGGDEPTLAKWQEEIKGDKEIPPAIRDKYTSILDTAQNLPDEMKAFSSKIRDDYQRDWQQMKAIGVIHPEAEGSANYAGQHTYVPRDEGGSTLRPIKARMTKTPGFTKERTFDTIVDALHKGFEPKEIGLAGARADYIRQFGEMRGAIAAEQELLKQQADDVRPIGINPASVKTVNGHRTIRLSPELDVTEIAKSLRQGGSQTEQPKTPDQAAAIISDLHNKNGGSTYNLATGDLTGKTAFAVSVSPDKMQVLDHSPSTKEISDFIKKNQDILNDPKFSIGTWKAPDGTHELSITATPDNLYDAAMLAHSKATPEKSMYDLKNKEEVPVPEKDTKQLHYNTDTNEWSPERQKLHQQIVEQHLAGKAPAEGKPTIYVLGGGTASGKTTLSRSVMATDPNIVRLDPDEFKLQIPEYDELKKTDPRYASMRVHEESKAVTRMALAEALKRKLNIVYDTTTSSGGKSEAIKAFKDAGYKVDLRFADIPIEEAIKRSDKRAKESTAIKRSDKRAKESTDPINFGRHVPRSVIEETHRGASKNFFELKNLADSAKLYNNEGENPRLIYERGENGEKIHDEAGYKDYYRKAGIQASGVSGARPADNGAGLGVVSEASEPGKEKLTPVAVSPRAEGIKTGEIVKAGKDEIGRKIHVKDGKLYLDVSDYKDAPDVFNRFRVRTIDKNGDPVFERSNVLIHPDYADQINKMFDNGSWFRKTPIFSSILKMSTQAKKTLLSGSPFHWNTEYLRGIQMGLNPAEAFNPKELTPDRLAVKARFGPTLVNNGPRELASEGAASNSTILHKIPVVGKLMKQAEDKLFSDYIPRLKADVFDKVVNQLSKRHTNWTDDQVHFASSKIVDSAFGGINWKMLGASTTGVDALRLVALAPDFTGSQILFAKAGFEPGGSVVHQSLARIALYNFAVARLLNMLISGKPHLEHPFGVVAGDNDKYTVSVRTMPDDILHALTDPRGFTYNRLNPLIARTGIEAVTGRDEQGKAVDTQKQLHDLLRNVLPIPTQGFVPGFHQEGQPGWIAAAKAVGFQVAPNQTTAEKMASKLASNHSESGPVDQSKLQHHQQLIQFEDAIRTKQAKVEDLYDAVDKGTMSVKDAKEILNNIKNTEEMPNDVAKLYGRAARLPMQDFLSVWQVATQPEKDALGQLFLKKKATYFKTVSREMTPAQRQNDPTYRKLRALFPADTPW